MPKLFALILFYACWLSLLAGCQPAAQPNPATQAEVLTLPTATPSVLTELATTPPTESSASASTSEVDWTITASVDGDYYVLGNPQAPVRLIDFSDFF